MNTRESNKDKGIASIVTGIYIAVIIALFWFVSFSKPEPPEEEGGLLVDFGYTDVGYGEEEPQVNPEATPIAPEQQPITESTPEKSTENMVTSDVEESVSVTKTDDTKNKVTENEEKIVQNPVTEPVLPKVEERKPNQRAIFTGFAKKSNSGSEGNTKGTGNMGVLDGGDSDIYKGKSTGLGNAGDGSGLIGTGLTGRKLNGIPDIADNSNKTGKIIIKVKVDKSGRVISAEFTAQGSTISDNDLVDKCEAAARKAVFSSAVEKEVDYGTLVFRFTIK